MSIPQSCVPHAWHLGCAGEGRAPWHLGYAGEGRAPFWLSGCLPARGRHTLHLVLLFDVTLNNRPLWEDLDTLSCVMAATGGWPCYSASCLSICDLSQEGVGFTPDRKNPVLSASPLTPEVRARYGVTAASCSVRCQQAEPHCLHTVFVSSLRAVLPDR